MSTPAGWYPAEKGTVRYWDGARWTDHVAPAPNPSRPTGVPPTPSGGPPAMALAGHAAWYGWGGLALTALAGAGAGFGGVVLLAGIYVLIVGIIALRRGRVAWARLRGRAASGLAVGTGFVLLVIGGATASPAGQTPTPQPVDLHPAASATAGAATGSSSTSAASSSPSTSPTTSGSSSATASPTATLPSAGPGTALAALATLPVKGRSPKTGYSRDEFGQAWADVDHNGCDTRNDILRRDLTNVVLKANTNGCLVLSGTLHDPYTGRTIGFVRGTTTSEAVQIDHVVALSDAWQKGAQQLSATTRTAFANDPLNLLAVDGPTNAAKGDGDAATWLPPNKAYRCAYVARQVAVKAKYHLWVTSPERDAIARVLSTCPAQTVPTAQPIPLGGGRTLAPAPTSAPPPAPVPAPAPKPPSAPTLSCRAQVSTASPTQNSTVTVTVATSAKAAVTATAHYKSKSTTLSATAASNGVASVPFTISHATIGYRVDVTVSVSSSGHTASCSTSFTPVG